MDNKGGRVLAVASGGGHWVQLLRLRPVFEGRDVTFVTVSRSYASDVPGRRLLAIRDATRWSRRSFLVMALQLAVIIVRVRPRVIVTTGAAPGYVAIRLGRLIGARTLWLDSIANCEELSMAGAQAGRHVDVWLTQWPELARPGGPDFKGAVL